MRRRDSIPGFSETFHGGRSGRVKRTNFWRCQQCGCRNDVTKTALAKDGDGLKVVSDKVGPTTFDVYENPIDTSAKTGCRFCGSLNWASRRPHKLPDANKLPATGWRRKRR